MDNTNWRVHTNERIGTFLREVYLYRNTGDGYVEHLTEGMILEKIKEGESSENLKPTFVADKEMLEALMDGLGRIGVEVKSDSFTKGKLEATENHLEDMRKLVFDKK